MNKLKNKKGITLIALVITIIVLLILAGVSIAMLTGENGILTKAQTSKTKSAQEEAREKVSLMLIEWKMENAINNVALNTFLMNDKYIANRKAQGIDNIEPEESNYIAAVTVGETAYDVIINAEDEKNPYIEDVAQAGKRLGVKVEIISDSALTETVEIKVTATAPEGETISNIELISGEVDETGTIEGKDTKTAGIKYTVSKNGLYKFKITTNNGTTKTVEKSVNKIFSAPVLNTDAVTTKGNTITIDTNKIASASNYSSSAEVQYKYYYKLSTATEFTETTNNPITGLEAGGVYDIKIKAYIGEEAQGLESEILEDIVLIKITLNKSEEEIGKGESVQLTATITPESEANKEIIWTSSDESIATITGNGTTVTVVASSNKPGEVEIKATIKDETEIFATCNIKVVERLYLYNNGDKCEEETNGWTLTKDTNGQGDINSYNYMWLKSPAGALYRGVTLSTNKAINLNGYKKVKICFTKQGDATTCAFGIKTTKIINVSGSSFSSGDVYKNMLTEKGENIIVDLDIEGINGDYYIGLAIGQTEVKIHQIWLEKY